MSHVDLVIVILKGDLESESVVGSATFAFHRVLIVADVLSIAVPADPTWLGSVLHRVNQRLLSLIIRAVWLDQIYYVELVADILANVGHFEVVPLGVTCRAIVVFEDQVVGVITAAEGPSKIS